MSTDGLAIAEDSGPQYRASLATSQIPRRYAYSRSTLEIKHSIWHLCVRESGYRESGQAMGQLLCSADYPAVPFWKLSKRRKISPKQELILPGPTLSTPRRNMHWRAQ